jgi:stage II sporulation protein D
MVVTINKMILQNLKSVNFIIQSLFLNKLSWLFCLVWLLMILPAQAVELKVAVEKEVDSLKVGSSTAAIVKDLSLIHI